MKMKKTQKKNTRFLFSVCCVRGVSVYFAGILYVYQQQQEQRLQRQRKRKKLLFTTLCFQMNAKSAN